jgi:hypothetical protein
MNTPLEEELEEAYQMFDRDHERLREELIDSVTQLEAESRRTRLPDHTGLSPAGLIAGHGVFKIAAGIILVGIIATVVKFWGDSNGVAGVAFGEVLSRMRNSSYTFDVTVTDKGRFNGPVEAMICEPGVLRLDNPGALGGISLIMDLTTNDLLVLYHEQKIAAKEIPDADIEDMSEEPEPLAMFAGPIERLWNLQDGTEESLGERRIDGRPAVGFEVRQEGGGVSSDIIVWAYKETGNPLRVELTLYNQEDDSEPTTITMSDFNLDAQLDEGLFSLEPPEGYTLAYQKELEAATTTGESTPEAEKIQHSIELWNSGEQEESIEIMLGIDWTQPITFSDHMYLFSMTQKRLMQLQPEDHQKVFKEIVGTLFQLRDICKKLWEAAQTAILESDYERAGLCLKTTLELARLINRDPEIVPVAQIASLTLQRKSLEEMASLYSQTDNMEKLRQVQDELKTVEADIKSYNKRSSLTGG